MGQGNIFIGVCQEFCLHRGLLRGGVSAGGCLLWRWGVSALGECLLLGGVCSGGGGGGCSVGGCLVEAPPPADTASGGTHPTGMHSWHINISISYFR